MNSSELKDAAAIREDLVEGKSGVDAETMRDLQKVGEE